MNIYGYIELAELIGWSIVLWINNGKNNDILKVTHASTFNRLPKMAGDIHMVTG